MPERCKQCERYEKNLKDLREGRTNLWRRGELTEAAADKLAGDELRIDEELRAHQASGHEHTQHLTAKTLVAERHPNLEEEIRRRAYELYEARGSEDGHDLDDWLRAEGEITDTAPKTATA